MGVSINTYVESTKLHTYSNRFIANMCVDSVCRRRLSRAALLSAHSAHSDHYTLRLQLVGWVAAVICDLSDLVLCKDHGGRRMLLFKLCHCCASLSLQPPHHFPLVTWNKFSFLLSRLYSWQKAKTILCINSCFPTGRCLL